MPTGSDPESSQSQADRGALQRIAILLHGAYADQGRDVQAEWLLFPPAHPVSSHRLLASAGRCSPTRYVEVTLGVVRPLKAARLPPGRRSRRVSREVLGEHVSVAVRIEEGGEPHHSGNRHCFAIEADLVRFEVSPGNVNINDPPG